MESFFKHIANACDSNKAITDASILKRYNVSSFFATIWHDLRSLSKSTGDTYLKVKEGESVSEAYKSILDEAIEWVNEISRREFYFEPKEKSENDNEFRAFLDSSYQPQMKLMQDGREVIPKADQKANYGNDGKTKKIVIEVYDEQGNPKPIGSGNIYRSGDAYKYNVKYEGEDYFYEVDNENQYVTPAGRLYELLRKARDAFNDGNTSSFEDYLKGYFYSELLERYRSRLLEEYESVNITIRNKDDCDYKGDLLLPKTWEVLNGRGGNIGALRTIETETLPGKGGSRRLHRMPISRFKVENSVLKLYIEEANVTAELRWLFQEQRNSSDQEKNILEIIIDNTIRETPEYISDWLSVTEHKKETLVNVASTLIDFVKPTLLIEHINNSEITGNKKEFIRKTHRVFKLRLGDNIYPFEIVNDNGWHLVINIPVGGLNINDTIDSNTVSNGVSSKKGWFSGRTSFVDVHYVDKDIIDNMVSNSISSDVNIVTRDEATGLTSQFSSAFDDREYAIETRTEYADGGIIDPNTNWIEIPSDSGELDTGSYRESRITTLGNSFTEYELKKDDTGLYIEIYNPDSDNKYIPSWFEPNSAEYIKVLHKSTDGAGGAPTYTTYVYKVLYATKILDTGIGGSLGLDVSYPSVIGRTAFRTSVSTSGDGNFALPDEPLNTVDEATDNGTNTSGFLDGDGTNAAATFLDPQSYVYDETLVTQKAMLAGLDSASGRLTLNGVNSMVDIPRGYRIYLKSYSKNLLCDGYKTTDENEVPEEEKTYAGIYPEDFFKTVSSTPDNNGQPLDPNGGKKVRIIGALIRGGNARFRV